MTLDVTLPLLLGLACWWLVERTCPEGIRRVEWPRARPAHAFAIFGALTAIVFVTKVNRLGRVWVAAGEEGRQHVREVFERFDIPRDRLQLVPGWQEGMEMGRTGER